MFVSLFQLSELRLSSWKRMEAHKQLLDVEYLEARSVERRDRKVVEFARRTVRGALVSRYRYWLLAFVVWYDPHAMIGDGLDKVSLIRRRSSSKERARG